MQEEERFAFTAKYWGQHAVVCRAVEDRPGPIVVQEFGEFDSWTQANSFARRLNEGLDLDPIEANRIVTCSELRTNELMQTIECMEGVLGRPRTRSTDKFLRVQCAIAELELALTFCRLVTRNPGRGTERLLRNARRALFNAMHSVLHSELAEADVELITDRMGRLAEALREICRQAHDREVTAGEAKVDSLARRLDAEACC